MEPPSTPFALQTSFPPVIFSYCTKTDGGRGEQRMWQKVHHDGEWENNKPKK